MPALSLRTRCVRLAIAVLVGALLIPASPARAEKNAAIDLDVRGRRVPRRVERSLGRTVAATLKERGYKVSNRGKVKVRVTIRGGRRWEARVRVIHHGRTVGSARIRARSRRALAKKLERRLWRAVGGDIERAVARQDARPETPERPAVKTPAAEPEMAAGPEPAAAEDAEEAAADNSETANAKASLSAEAEAEAEVGEGSKSGSTRSIDVAIVAGLQMFSRNLTYTDDLFAALREYKLAAAPAFVVRAEIYPLAAVTSGALANLGVGGMLARSPELSARTPEGTEVGSEATAYALGVRYRYQLGDATLAAAGDFGVRTFTIEDDAARMSTGVPDTDYRYLRLGVAAALPLSAGITAGAGGGYRHLLSAGEIEEDRYFPRLSAAGVDATLYLGYALTSVVDVELGGRIERYFYSMNPEPGDPMIAGGAVDQYLAAFLRLRYTP